MPRLIGAVQALTNQAEQITTFNSSGTLTTGAITTELEYLIVAGGGGGANQPPAAPGPGGYGGGGNGNNPTGPNSSSGAANTGGGAGGGVAPHSSPGGSGIVIVKEPSIPKSAPGVWSMNTVYDLVKQGEWGGFNPSFIQATGGTISESGDYRIHTFT